MPNIQGLPGIKWDFESTMLYRWNNKCWTYMETKVVRIKRRKKHHEKRESEHAISGNKLIEVW